jgi:hypothetical protein
MLVVVVLLLWCETMSLWNWASNGSITRPQDDI